MDLVDLLFEFRADPHRVDLWSLLDTLDLSLYERFRAAGVDMTRGHHMALHLAEHAGIKPLFGFANKHRETDPAIQRELDLALYEHARETSQKSCSERIRRRHSRRFDRQKLLQAGVVRAGHPVAKSYGVSGVYLARVCRELRVPAPPGSYWARMRSGQRLRQPRLPRLTITDC